MEDYIAITSEGSVCSLESLRKKVLEGHGLKAYVDSPDGVQHHVGYVVNGVIYRVYKVVCAEKVADDWKGF